MNYIKLIKEKSDCEALELCEDNKTREHVFYTAAGLGRISLMALVYKQNCKLPRDILHFGIVSKNRECVIWLLDRGANPNALTRDAEGYTVSYVELALQAQFEQIIDTLYEYGMIYVEDHIIEAVNYHSTRACGIILDSVYKAGKTSPVTYAAMNNDLKLTAFLLKRGLPAFNSWRSRFYHPIVYSVIKQSDALFEYLLPFTPMWVINTRLSSHHYNTLLHICVIAHKEYYAHKLIAAGASQKIKNKSGYTIGGILFMQQRGSSTDPNQ